MMISANIAADRLLMEVDVFNNLYDWNFHHENQFFPDEKTGMTTVCFLLHRQIVDTIHFRLTCALLI